MSSLPPPVSEDDNRGARSFFWIVVAVVLTGLAIRLYILRGG